MNKPDFVEFLDHTASCRDTEMSTNAVILEKILDNAEIEDGQDILDVACGTGALLPYYLRRGVASVTGIEISPEMAKIAEETFAAEPRVRIICSDVEKIKFKKKFDRIVVFNALPHFPKPKRLVKMLSGLLKENGRLTIAHGMTGSGSTVFKGLIPVESLKKIFDPHFTVEVMISNGKLYQVSGVKRDPLAHSHDGDVEHTHGGLTHSHAHGDLDHEHHLDENATPLKELLVMMKYLVSHNDAHAQEVAELARNLQAAGRIDVYDAIMDAVADFDMVNAKLDAVLNKLLMEER